MQKLSAKLPSESRSQKPDSPSSEAERPATRLKETDWDIVGLEDEAATASGTSETEEGEVMRYHLEKIQPLASHPLVWWKEKQFSYPRLANVAKEVLCVPSTSTPSERMFSAAGLIVNEQRAALHADNVDALVFLSKNMPKLFDMTRS